VPSVGNAVTLDGKLFQTRGAATKKARSPIVDGTNIMLMLFQKANVVPGSSRVQILAWSLVCKGKNKGRGAYT